MSDNFVTIYLGISEVNMSSDELMTKRIICDLGLEEDHLGRSFYVENYTTVFSVVYFKVKIEKDYMQRHPVFCSLLTEIIRRFTIEEKLRRVSMDTMTRRAFDDLRWFNTISGLPMACSISYGEDQSYLFNNMKRNSLYEQNFQFYVEFENGVPVYV